MQEAVKDSYVDTGTASRLLGVTPRAVRKRISEHA